MKKAKFMNKNSIHQHERRGAVSVEVAMCLPILFLFTFFAFEFSRVTFLRRAMDEAAYSAAREIKVPGATAAEAIAKVDEILNTVGANSYTVTVTPTTITDNTEYVTVSITAAIQNNIVLTSQFFKGRSLTASAKLKTERFRN
jgi:Flp pilus assembly protein TadG